MIYELGDGFPLLLKDKVVMIAGIGPGLGARLAVAAAREGADVALAARTEPYLEEVAAKVRTIGRRAIAVPTDLAKRDQCDRFVARTLDEFGCIDALINNARAAEQGLFETADLEAWRRVMEINCFGYLQLAQGVVEPMKRQGRGAIVMVNTMNIKAPPLATGAYATSKGAVAAATRVLAKELAPHGIRVNQVYLGWMWGEPVRNLLTYTAAQRGVSVEEIKDEIARNIPLGRIPEDEICTGPVLFLASDYAEAVIGASIDVNGGELLGA
jgi:NAD(P)-dependent dehydrogenase (short-subunit alcohol dehydrogenase family)